MDKFKKRISDIQGMMSADGVDMYLVDDADLHGSEYVNEYYKLRTYISGFTGSNGKLLICKDEAYLWTDGRYFIQAEKELGDNAVLMKMGAEGVPLISDFITDKGGVLGFDGDNISASFAATLMDKSASKRIELEIRSDLKYGREAVADEGLVIDYKPVRILPSELYGKSASKKIEKVREYIKKKNADIYLQTKLDTNMFLTNLRGDDVEYNPVAFSYVVITTDDAYFFLASDAYKDNKKEVVTYLKDNGINLIALDKFNESLEVIAKGKKVIAPFDNMTVSLFELLTKKAGAEFIPEDDEIETFKAIKEPVEQELLKKVYLKDSVVLTKFIYKLLKSDFEKMSEYDAMVMLDEMRLSEDGCYGLSFDTISAYGANAAMMHYESHKDNCAMLEKKGMYLVDSGGQWDGGTTDVTRTIRLGECTEEMIKHYTLTAVGMLRLQNAVFIKGATGINLDILARQPLWEIGEDYKCGTGHGIGYMLNVHEGPHNISTKTRANKKPAPIVPGMIVSDEPGVYKKDKYGIRIENILLCEDRFENEGDYYYGFAPLTLVPLDGSLIDKKYMNSDDVKLYERYQNQVLEALNPYMDEDEKEWLREYIKG